MEQLIVLKGLTKRFGQMTAVKDICLNVSKKQVLGFLGPNGAGKSTTMKMISGFLEPTSGTAEIAGFDVINNPVEVKSHIGYLPEGAPTYSDMTPNSFLQFIAEIRGFDGKDRQSRIDLVVEQVRLKEVLFQSIETLSKGYKRRVGLAQAMLHNPQVLILDEPTDGLDPNQKHHIRMLINEMAQEKAIIVSTHILEEVEAVCTDALIIANGEVMKKGTPDELLETDPHHNTIVVRTSISDAQKVQGEFERFGKISPMNQADRNDGLVGFCLLEKSKKVNLTEVRKLISEKNLPVEEVFRQKGTLDRVFIKITSLNNGVGYKNA
jgi:ABC-2 type transport system ATP-binding protein